MPEALKKPEAVRESHKDIATQLKEVMMKNTWTRCEIKGLLYPKLLYWKLKGCLISTQLRAENGGDIIVELINLSEVQRRFLIDYLNIILTKAPEDGVDREFTVSVVFSDSKDNHEFRTTFNPLPGTLEKIRASVRELLRVLNNKLMIRRLLEKFVGPV